MARRAKAYVALRVEGKEPFLSPARTLLKESGCIVVMWRRSLSGCAYTEAGEWCIEVPKPTTPKSFGVFAHEVGHHMLEHANARTNSKPQWLEELEVWKWALDQFGRFDLPGREQSLADARRSMSYAFSKSIRRSSDADRKVAEYREAVTELGMEALFDVEYVEKWAAHVKLRIEARISSRETG